MGRRTRRENQRTARQARLYEETAPIITNEQIAEAFDEQMGSRRIHAVRAILQKYDGTMQATEPKARNTCKIKLAPGVLGIDTSDPARVDVAVIAGKYLAIRSGKSVKVQTVKNGTMSIMKESETGRRTIESIAGDRMMCGLMKYGTQGGADLFEIVKIEEGEA